MQVFIGLVVAAVVFHLFAQAHGLGGAVEVAGDDVPADPPATQMIEGRQASGEQVRRFVGQIGGQAKAEVFLVTAAMAETSSSGSLTGNWIDSLSGTSTEFLIDVVHTDDVGDEQTVEQSALQQLRQFSPVFDGFVLSGIVPWMRPQAMVDVPDAVHVERVEQDFSFFGISHQMVPRNGGFSSLR